MKEIIEVPATFNITVPFPTQSFQALEFRAFLLWELSPAFSTAARQKFLLMILVLKIQVCFQLSVRDRIFYTIGGFLPTELLFYTINIAGVARPHIPPRPNSVPIFTSLTPRQFHSFQWNYFRITLI